MDPVRGKDGQKSSAEWKKAAMKELLKDFLSATSPDVDLQPFTPAVEGVLDMALTEMAVRVRSYGELCADRVRKGPDFDVMTAEILLRDLEASHNGHLEERRDAMRRGSRDFAVLPLMTTEGPSLGNPGDLHLQAMDECYHRLKDVQPKQTGFLVALYEERILSLTEYESMMAEPTERKANEEVFRKARGLSQSVFENHFIRAMKRDEGNAFRATELSDVISRLKLHPEDRLRGACRVCSLRDRVDPRRLAEGLRASSLIPIGLHSDIRRRTMPTDRVWEKIFGHVEDPQKLLPVLKKKYPGVHDDMVKYGVVSLQCQCPAPALGMQGRVATQMDENDSDEPRSSSSTSSMTSESLILPEYKMTSPKRGCCLLVVNDSIRDRSVSESTLDMTFKTADVLHDLFLRLRFDVTDKQNLSAKELKEEAKKIAQMDHSSLDCLAVVLLIPPGKDDTLSCSDGNIVSVREIRAFFRSSKCPSLAGKPKIFYRPFSRGYDDQGGIRVSDESGKEQLIEDDADFLMIETCPPGCKTSRDGVSMVVDHVQLLAKALDQYGPDLDLLACLTMVNNQLSGVRTSQGIYVTAPIHSTLKKQLKFPKLS